MSDYTKNEAFLKMSKPLQQKVNKAICTLQSFDLPDEPYYLCYSGGKDSDCIRLLADLAGVNYELHNNHTTVDTPVTVKYIREVMSKYGEKTFLTEYDGTKATKYGERGFVHYPTKTMWELIASNTIPPIRRVRYCCEELKEKGGKGRRKVTGVRWAESKNRKNNQGLITIIGKPVKTKKIAAENSADFRETDKGGLILNTDNDGARRTVEMCYRTTSTLINPIIDWTDEDVWGFLREMNCESNPEYKTGAKRIGCIGCPMSSNQKKELAMYPKYREAYVRAFEKMLKNKKQKGLSCGAWDCGESVMRWWVGDDPLQLTFEDYEKFLDEQEIILEDMK